jgi:uncharacterized phage-like protein YoqJ
VTFAVAFTGHRPEKLGGYNEPNPVRDALKAKLREKLLLLTIEHPDLLCISGMALGFDQWAAETCVELGIPFTAAVPFHGQHRAWPFSSQQRYSDLLAKAKEVVTVNPGPYAAWKMMARNEYMIEHADLLVAAWDGSSGGTKNAVDYALKKGRRVVNLLGEVTPSK